MTAWVYEPPREGLEVMVLDGRRAEGHVVALDGGEPWSLRYEVFADAGWRTRRVELLALAGNGARRMLLEADGRGGWEVDGSRVTELHGCLDVDLGATVFTNTLPIRRLHLAVGEAADVAAVWVAPRLDEVEVLAQRYQRVDALRYAYSVPASGFEAELAVDGQGLVVTYSGLARRAG
jgi:hypothetical protein